MSVPVMVGLLALVVIVAGAAGVWRARGRSVNTQQSSLMLLLLVVVAAVLVWFVMGR